MLTGSRNRRALTLHLAVCACPLILTLPVSAAITVGYPSEVSPPIPATWNSGTTAQVGISAGKTATLTVDGGSKLSGGHDYLGYGVGSTGNARVTGAGSNWSDIVLYVGFSGTGALTIDAGGCVANPSSDVGYNSGSRGQVSVTGAGSAWIVSGWLDVGESGTGALSIEDGGTVQCGLGYIAVSHGSVGQVTVTGAGSNWMTAPLYVGVRGSGTLTIANGGSVTSSGSAQIGGSVGSVGQVTVSGTGSTWTAGYLSVAGGSRLTITDGGSVDANGGPVQVGSGAGSVGQVTVTGAGSMLSNKANLVLGSSNAQGTLTIADSGKATTELVSISSGSALNLHVSGNGMFATGGVSNSGRINLYADAALSSGVYTPISGNNIFWTGSGTCNAFGGTWDSTAHTFTVAAPTSLAAGVASPVTTGQRLNITAVASPEHVGASFGAVFDGATFAADPMTPDELSSLALDPGQSILSAWDFTTNLSGSTVLLSFDVGADASNLEAWHYSGGVWTPYAASDLTCSNGIASFTVNSFSGYAVTGLVPEPTGLALLAVAAIALRRRPQGTR